MNKWKIIRIITIVLLIAFVVFQVVSAVKCMNREQYFMKLAVTMFWCGIPLLVDIVLLIVSFAKTREK